MKAKALEVVVGKILRLTNYQVLKEPSQEPLWFDFGIIKADGQRVAIEVKILDRAKAPRKTVTDLLKKCNDAGYQELWLISERRPKTHDLYRLNSADERTILRCFSLGEFAVDSGVHLQAVLAELRGNIISSELGLGLEELVRQNEAEKGENQLTTGQSKREILDSVFATIRRDSGIRWSTTLDRVLDLLWEEQSKMLENVESGSGAHIQFNTQITPRMLFLSALLYGARQRRLLTRKSRERGQTLIIVWEKCGRSESELLKLLNKEFLSESKLSDKMASGVAPLVLSVLRQADSIRQKFGRDPYIATRHLLLALLQPPYQGRTGEFVIGADDNISMKGMLDAFEEALTTSNSTKRYDIHADWSMELEKLRQAYSNTSTGQPVPITGTSPSTPAKQAVQQSTGHLFCARREAAADELCLDIRYYAAAIAETFAAAASESDFVFALYAPWGRGKSTLIREVALNLSQSELQNAKVSYKTVFFSAWKYPTRPEVWVFLHQQIANIAQEGGLWQKLRIRFRFGLLKNGWWPLFIGFGVLAFSRVQWELAHWLLNTVGVFGIGILASFVWKSFRTGGGFEKAYFAMPDHAEKLGLQAVVGRDLMNLLKVWVNPIGLDNQEANKDSDVCNFSKPMTVLRMCFLVVLMWIVLGLVWWKIYKAQPNPAATVSFPSSPSQTNLLARLQLDWKSATRSQRITIVLLAALGIMLPIFAYLIAVRPRQFNRILLVVDDLDRCEPSQMVAIIESLRLFLDEPEMSKRLQVAMLLDRSIFKRVILAKARDSHTLTAETDIAQKEAFFREQEEKLFVVTFELPDLDSEKVADLAAKIIDREHRRALRQQLAELQGEMTALRALQADGRDMEPSSLEGEPQDDDISSLGQIDVAEQRASRRETRAKMEAIEMELSEPESLGSQNPDHKRNVRKIVFEDHERESLKGFLSSLKPAGVTPRSLRAFVVRYQLVRLVLGQLGHVVEPDVIITALGARLYPNSGISHPMLSPVVESVVRSVAGELELKTE